MGLFNKIRKYVSNRRERKSEQAELNRRLQNKCNSNYQTKNSQSTSSNYQTKKTSRVVIKREDFFAAPEEVVEQYYPDVSDEKKKILIEKVRAKQEYLCNERMTAYDLRAKKARERDQRKNLLEKRMDRDASIEIKRKKAKIINSNYYQKIIDKQKEKEKPAFCLADILAKAA